MATIHIKKPGEPDGVKRPGDPLPRPYVTLKDGRVMTHEEWESQGGPE